MMGLLEGALKRNYPDTDFDLPPFFQFGSWIGGDRDGNPFVTTEVTGWALRKNAMAALHHYRDRLIALARSLSISQRALPVPEASRRTWHTNCGRAVPETRSRSAILASLTVSF